MENKASKCGADRLSMLPDDLLISILSFVDAKTTAQTTVLSKHWKNLWRKVAVLNFDFKHLEVFRDEDDQNRFLDNFLTRRDNLILVYSLTLSFQFMPSQDLARRIILYSISHEVEELFCDCVTNRDDVYLSPNTFTCPTLTKLTLISLFDEANVVWELPNLRILYLFLPTHYDISPLPSQYLSCLPNLTTLGLSRGQLPISLALPNLTSLKLYTSLCFEDSKNFFSTLVNLESLTMSFDGGVYEDILVETPNLAHLSIVYPIDVMIDDMNDRRCKLMIFAPRVRSFSCLGLCPFMFEGLVSLDYVEIKLEDCDEISTIIPLQEFEYCRRVITDMFLAVSSAKVLSLDSNILKVLSELNNVIRSSPPAFRNLKYLKVPEWYSSVSNFSTSLNAFILGLSTDAKIVTELPKVYYMTNNI